MKIVSMLAKVDPDNCIGCQTCVRVCPVKAIKVENRKAVVNIERCSGCAACEQRCPQYAIAMIKRDEPKVVKVDVNAVDYGQIEKLCGEAKLHPEQIVCFCTGTRAEEIAAAILQGADSPEEVSHRTGARTGCKVECIQPILRLLEAAKVKLTPPKDGWQWYGRTVTVWEIPKAVREKYNWRGFYFDEDAELLDKVISAPKQERRDI